MTVLFMICLSSETLLVLYMDVITLGMVHKLGKIKLNGQVRLHFTNYQYTNEFRYRMQYSHMNSAPSQGKMVLLWVQKATDGIECS